MVRRHPVARGYRGEGRWLLLNRQLPNPAGFADGGVLPRAVRRAGRGRDTAEPELEPGVLRAAAHAGGVEPGGYWAFAPGAEYGPAKCWPAGHYAELARRLHASDGLTVLLLGSGKEAALCQQIADAAPGACRVLADRPR